ncbi:hypothetical protein ACHAL6_04550 [Proteiniclasticum sp. C24MP]|uniref:hypothetical protein n=1 Tax=Proteiniclasticum sp. C24MP TaxID=3374101 RepID=UPI003753F37A
MAKRWIHIALMLTSFLILTGCHPLSIQKRISDSTGISIPHSMRIDYEDTHGGFHGDGETTAIVAFHEDASKDVRAEISENMNWLRLPLEESLDIMMYGGVKDGILYTYEYAELLSMPRIENGYWYFEDRLPEGSLKELLALPSYNFTVAVYDFDTDILYYLEVDT